MEPITIALLLGGAVLLRGKRRRRGKGGVSAGIDQPRTRAQRLEMLARIRDMANWSSKKWGMMPYLADYLTVVAYWESRFNETRTNPEYKRDPKNAARGLFQMRPTSAFRDTNNLVPLQAKGNLLLDPRWAFVTAVDYAVRADVRSQQKSGRQANWLAARRWWRVPKLVHDYSESDAESQSVHRKILEAIAGVNAEYGQNVDEDFIYRPVDVGGYPGIWATMPAFGLDPRSV